MGSKRKRYSAPKMANNADFKFLFIVEKYTLPPGFNSVAQAPTTKSGCGTCSRTSKHVIISNIPEYSDAKFSAVENS